MATRNLVRDLLSRSLFLGHRWPHRVPTTSLHHIRPISVSLSNRVSEDRIEMFMEPGVQTLLKQLTGKDYERVFRKRKIGQRLKEPKYSFMTEEQLKISLEEADQRADSLLQMPPVLRARPPIEKELSYDPQIQGVEKSTIIFTDISMNITDRDRIIVARDPDGSLRQASWDERDRMNAIYFSHPGREFLTPKMFTEPDLLKAVLGRASEQDNTYEFVLDRACIQFEPDNPLFISICETTYQTIDKKQDYDFLKSTRHFGPMAFYLVRTRQMDNLLMYCIKHERVSDDSAALISLFHQLFPESKSKSVAQGLTKAVDKIRAYIELDAVKRTELELELNAYEEVLRKRNELTEELEKSHGIQQKN